MISAPFLLHNSLKKIKTSPKKVNQKSDAFFNVFLTISGPLLEPLGPPWAPFFALNAVTVPGPSAPGRFLVIFVCFQLLQEPLGPLRAPFLLNVHQT